MALQVQRASRLSRRASERKRRGALLPAAVLGIVVLVPLAVLMGTVLALGWQLQVIKTGSMEPRLPTGSLAVVEPIDAAEVRTGMVIVFDDPAEPGRLVSHRVIRRLSGEPPAWQTKGDANRTADAYPVHAAAVRGRVRWTIPRLGLVVTRLRTPFTPALLIGLPLALLAVTEVARLRRRKRAAAPPAVFVHAVQSGSTLIDVFVRHEDAQQFIERQETPERLVIVRHELTSGDAT